MPIPEGHPGAYARMKLPRRKSQINKHIQKVCPIYQRNSYTLKPQIKKIK